MNKLLHVPILSAVDIGVARSPGPGLGNLLFPIARAVVGKESLGGVVVVPTMRQIKFGTYLRREKDKRTYGDIFRSRTSKEWSDWIYAKVCRSRAEESERLNTTAITYRGMGRQFHDLMGYDRVIKDYFCSLSRLDTSGDNYDIAVHVRLGDFDANAANGSSQNFRLPVEWYQTAIRYACDLLELRVPRGILFTDEDPSRIISNMGLSGFEPEPPGNALTTIFAMSRARILIASQSTFSLWAQYLGQSKAIWPSGFDLGRYKSIDLAADYFC